jgi:DNA-binding response OmpR family regulator
MSEHDQESENAPAPAGAERRTGAAVDAPETDNPLLGDRKESILVVDDDPIIARLLEIELLSAGYEVRLAGNGEDALALAQERRPDLVLLDVMMPGMDGPATLGELRKIAGTADVAVAFMTAKVQPWEIARYREMGAIGVIMKPFDPMTLSDEVRSIWSEHESRGKGAQP